MQIELRLKVFGRFANWINTKVYKKYSTEKETPLTTRKGEGMKRCKMWVVITSINPPTATMRALAKIGQSIFCSNIRYFSFFRWLVYGDSLWHKNSWSCLQWTDIWETGMPYFQKNTFKKLFDKNISWQSWPQIIFTVQDQIEFLNDYNLLSGQVNSESNICVTSWLVYSEHAPTTHQQALARTVFT